VITLIDGYNVTKADPATRDLSLEDQRRALVRRLRTSTPGAGRGVTVIFDGRSGVTGAEDSGAVQVRFSHGGTADDLIVEIASRAEGQITLVTSDNELRGRVRTVARHAVSFRDRTTAFEGAPSPRTRRKRSGGIERDAGLPPGAGSITRELKELWLDEPED
jgi:predicted RNA-binding protein with PIN domain